MTRELVDALVSGDSIAIENAFGDAMSQKVSQALDNYRVSVAQRMFGVEPQEEISVNDNVNEA